MIFVAWRLHELARAKGQSLYDLTKAYDSDDRQLLWAVVGRAGVPPKMLVIIRGFHAGRRARVKMDDGKCSD